MLSMTTAEKSRETNIRRAAERQGLALHKSRRRDPRALGYGSYWLADATNTIVYPDIAQPRTEARLVDGVSLDEIEAWLLSAPEDR